MACAFVGGQPNSGTEIRGQFSDVDGPLGGFLSGPLLIIATAGEETWDEASLGPVCM